LIVVTGNDLNKRIAENARFISGYRIPWQPWGTIGKLVSLTMALQRSPVRSRLAPPLNARA
jgi:hypothetical protein